MAATWKKLAYDDDPRDWTTDSDAWVYASSTTFTIAGKDVTSRFPIGAMLTFSQATGGTKYFYVVGSAFSTNTTITVAAGNVHSITNETITLPKYSYMSCPTGFPHWFDYTPSYLGCAVAPSGGQTRFKVSGRQVTVNVVPSTAGTSNDTIFQVSLPIQAKTLTGISQVSFVLALNMGLWSIGYAQIASAAWWAVLRPTIAPDGAVGWGAIRGKMIFGTITYEI